MCSGRILHCSAWRQAILLPSGQGGLQFDSDRARALQWPARAHRMLGEVHDCGCRWGVPSHTAPGGRGHRCEPVSQRLDTRKVQMQPCLRPPQLWTCVSRQLFRGQAGAGSNVACGMRGWALQKVRVREYDKAGGIATCARDELAIGSAPGISGHLGRKGRLTASSAMKWLCCCRMHIAVDLVIAHTTISVMASFQNSGRLLSFVLFLCMGPSTFSSGVLNLICAVSKR